MDKRNLSLKNKESEYYVPDGVVILTKYVLKNIVKINKILMLCIRLLNIFHIELFLKTLIVAQLLLL